MVLGVDSVSLQSKGPSVTFSLDVGQTVGVFGPTGSGKSRFLRVLAGSEKPARGSVKSKGEVAIAQLPTAWKRLSPLAICQKFAGPTVAERTAETLSALGLWESRKESLSSLGQGACSLATLIPVLTAQAKLMVIDGQLDSVDTWRLPAVLDLIADRLRSGCSLAISSHRAELAKRMDTLVVLNSEAVVFAGTLRELESSKPSTKLEVETHHQPGVRAIVAPFEVEITRNRDGGTTISAKEGQKIAAKLLTEGYGDVKAIVMYRPDAEELLRGLIS